MMEDIEKLRQEAARADKAAQDARARLEAAHRAQEAARLEPLKALVVRAHACLCRWNHTDGCGWGYEESARDPWACEAHARWLRKYGAIILGDAHHKPTATMEEVELILSAAEALKPKLRTGLWLLRAGGLEA